ncbi:hypothetical protein [Schlesneria paludicola]|uniref:hypothetical protein n=1 Tax=Schlesneria paludicola TaxID=360056 RepID=UPI000299CE9B|nr:hypothetical protein [Schlesneria paludicola]
MSPLVFVHVIISLFGIVSGFVVVSGFLTGKRSNGWTAFFLTTTIATSLSGFLLPADRFMPSHAVGILSLITLSLAVFGRYLEKVRGRWNDTFVVNSLISQYFNVFVLVTQLFQKVPSLRELAPTQSELPFVATHLFVLSAFIVVGIKSVQRLRVARLQAVLGMITF